MKLETGTRVEKYFREFYCTDGTDENEDPAKAQRRRAAIELREAFGLRGACSRFRAIPAIGQRQPVLRSGTAEGGQAGRTPDASRGSSSRNNPAA